MKKKDKKLWEQFASSGSKATANGTAAGAVKIAGNPSDASHSMHVFEHESFISYNMLCIQNEVHYAYKKTAPPHTHIHREI